MCKIEILQTMALSSAGVSNRYLNFSKEQEDEADYYSLKTLEMLKHKTKGNLNSEEESLLDAVLKEFETELAKD